MRRFLFWSLCFCLLFPVGLSSCDGSDSAAVIFGGTTGKLTWTLTEDGVLTITGEGPMPDYRDGGTSETPPWYPHVNRISSLTIGEGVTRIGDYAFMLCSFVTEVVIPESVTSMGDWAFWHCQSLKRITFPDRMVRFGEWAFYENESLQSVCIPEGVTTIPSSAFARCHNLTCVIMPGSLQTICGGAFSQCHKLTDVTIPDGVTVIETGAFPYMYGFAGGLYRRWSYRDCRESVCGMHRIENGRYRKEYSAYRRSGLQYEEFLGSDDPGEDYRFVRRYCVRLFPGVGERFERRLPETRRLGSGFL